MAKKMTIVEKFAKVENILNEGGYSELAEFIAERSALHSKKITNRKPTATQIANEGLSNTVYKFMSENAGTKYTVSQLIKLVPECSGLSNQKVSAIVRSLVNADKVERIEEKGSTYFVVQ